MPNRSFPVPDCKHVATAKAYLNRSKFSAATKRRIAACINRKAKQLGCKTSKPAKVNGSVDVTWEDLTAAQQVLAETEIFKTTKELVEKSLKSDREMDLPFDENCL